MKKILFTLMLLVASTVTMSAQSELEQTSTPYIIVTHDEYSPLYLISIENTDEDENAQIYWGYCLDGYNEIDEWWLYDGNQICFNQPGNYQIEAYAIADGKSPSVRVIQTLTIEIIPLAAPLVYAHHVDDEKGLAVHIVDCMAGENYVDPDDHEVYYDVYYECCKPDGFYYKINDADEWTQYDGEFYLEDYGVYEIKAMSSLGDRTAHGDDAAATVIYQPSLFMSQDKGYIVRDGQVYYEREDSTLFLADHFYDSYHFMHYPIIEPEHGPNITIPSVIHISDKDYTVTEIGLNGLQSYNEVSIPSTVTHIDVDYSRYYDIWWWIMIWNPFTIVTVDENNPVYDSRYNCNAVIETATNTLIMGSQNTVIPEDVTSIGEFAFAGPQLTNIVIPASVSNIGRGAYYGMQFSSVTCKATVPPSASEVFLVYGEFYDYDYDYNYKHATLFVPAESLEAYRAHEEWGKFTRIVPFIGAGPGDINGDGNISIADVTNLIDQLLSGEMPAWGDVNGDGNVSIQDVTMLIDYLLSGTW